MKKDGRLTALGSEMVAGLSAFRETLESGVPIATRHTVRTISLDLHARPYSPDDVRRVRAHLGASQALFAEFLGVGVKALRSWEQGSRPVPMIACRFMDEIVENPELWTRRIRRSTRSRREKAAGS